LFYYTPEEVKAYYSSLKLKGSLDSKAGSSMGIYIVDKQRGTLVEKEVKEYKGYDTFHPSDLSNEMIDDF
jgi:hypothetical protein